MLKGLTVYTILLFTTLILPNNFWKLLKFSSVQFSFFYRSFYFTISRLTTFWSPKTYILWDFTVNISLPYLYIFLSSQSHAITSSYIITTLFAEPAQLTSTALHGADHQSLPSVREAAEGVMGGRSFPRYDFRRWEGNPDRTAVTSWHLSQSTGMFSTRKGLCLFSLWLFFSQIYVIVTLTLGWFFYEE